MTKPFAKVALCSAFVVSFTRRTLGVVLATLSADVITITRFGSGSDVLLLLLRTPVVTSLLSLSVVCASSTWRASSCEVDVRIISGEF